MKENILMNKQFRRYFPPFAAVIFIGVFASLAFWQLDRATQKEALLAQFSSEADFMPLNGGLPDNEYQPIEVRGSYRTERQILIENIVRDGRIGYFVITPVDQAGAGPLLLVNRGWLARPAQQREMTPIEVTGEARTLRGRAGHLPLVGVRGGAGFDGAGDWPKNAVYPTYAEVAHELGEELLPFVLLLDPQEDDGFRRQWRPQGSGPMTNYGYAFQWFAMAVAVFAILVFQSRKRARGRTKE
ncbi:MAG: surfeit locus 1 family protein [Woeseiaceae bacterium]|jgi:surfeit locus 1 family protein